MAHFVNPLQASGGNLLKMLITRRDLAPKPES